VAVKEDPDGEEGRPIDVADERATAEGRSRGEARARPRAGWAPLTTRAGKHHQWRPPHRARRPTMRQRRLSIRGSSAKIRHAGHSCLAAAREIALRRRPR
jgi:hypothetical protein